jgi:DNA polymerase elongation subunit (family B)
MGIRDPGTKPKPGDRMKFAFIKKEKTKGMLQGECIEDPAFIKEHNLKIDYDHYITNQLLKPIQQVLEIVLDDIKGFQERKGSHEEALMKFKDLPSDKFEKKKEMLRLKEIQHLLASNL